MPEDSKYYGRYPANKAEHAKYNAGQSYKGADGKTYPGKTKGRREAGTQSSKQARLSAKIQRQQERLTQEEGEEFIRSGDLPSKIKQPDERVGIDEKVAKRREQKQKLKKEYGKEMGKQLYQEERGMAKGLKREARAEKRTMKEESKEKRMATKQARLSAKIQRQQERLTQEEGEEFIRSGDLPSRLKKKEKK